MQSKCSPIFRSILSNPLSNISQQIHQDISEIGGQIVADIEMGLHLHHYVQDGFGNNLQGAVAELERCGCGGLSFCASKIQSLCWYREISSSNVLALQKALNKIPGSDTLTEDGVYGEKTSSAWANFMETLMHGTVPTLAVIDPLQSGITGITIGATTKGVEQGVTNAFVIGRHPYFRFDPPHPGKVAYFRGVKQPINYPHVNLDPVSQSDPALYKWIQSRYNHYPISDEAYDILKNLESTGEVIRIAGRVLLVAGAVSDAVKIGSAMNEDLNDADGKLGKTTLSTVAEIGGSWAGAFGGAKLGALVGAMTGPAAPVAVPVLGIIGGVAGSIGGSSLAEWVVDITCLEE